MQKHYLKLRTKLVQTCLAVLLVGFAAIARGAQIVDGSDGNSKEVIVSAKELTRISVEGGAVVSVIFSGTDLDYVTDEATGQIFLKPGLKLTNPDRPINAFITTSSGTTHALVMVVKDVPLATIQLREQKVLDEKARKLEQEKAERAKIEAARERERDALVNAGNKGNTVDVAVRSVLIALSHDAPVNAMQCTAHTTAFALWKEADFSLNRKCIYRQLVGERYSLRNISPLEMKLAEQELYKQGVVAISIEFPVLRPGEATDVFIVRGNNEQR